MSATPIHKHAGTPIDLETTLNSFTQTPSYEWGWTHIRIKRLATDTQEYKKLKVFIENVLILKDAIKNRSSLDFLMT